MIGRADAELAEDVASGGYSVAAGRLQAYEAELEQCWVTEIKEVDDGDFEEKGS